VADQRVLLGWMRRATLLAVVAGAFYAASRFELLEMPADRCSPLRAIAPGTTLVVDLQPRNCRIGDVVFHEGAQGELRIGRVAEVLAGGLWIVTDDESCSVPDSASLGPVGFERLRGRVVLRGNW
jgi:hypothetical protein